MNTRFIELLARFNAKTCRFDIGIGGGGGPIIGQAEVADGLTAIQDRIGGAILCCTAWPDSRSAYIGDVQGFARAALIEEHDRRLMVYRDALAEAERESREVTPRRSQSRSRAEILLSAAKAQLWPDWRKNVERYSRIPEVAVDEITRCPTVCISCGGNRTVRKFGKEVDCDACEGTGMYRAAHGHRARAIGVRRQTYRQTWAQPYEYIHAELIDRMWTAAADFSDRIKANLRAAG